MSKKNREGKAKKRKSKIFLCTVLAVLITAGILIGVACAVLGTEVVSAGFKNLLAEPVSNIKAAWLFITNDSDAIKDQLDATKKEFDDAVKDATGTELSDEVKNALESGKYTEEEMALIISGVSIEEIDRLKELEKNEINKEDPEKDEHGNEVSDPVIPDEKEEKQPEVPIVVPEPVIPDTPETPEIPKVPEVEVPVPEEPSVPEITDDTAATIAKMYIIKNKFMKKLESIEVDILNDYVSYPKEERNPKLRKSIAGQYISTVADLELQCDAEVEVVLAELKTKLTSLGKDLVIIDTIRKAYADEKSLKKAYYMDIYLNGLRGKPIPKDNSK